MSPTFATRVAVRAWPWRMVALAVAVLAFGLLFVALLAGSQGLAQVAFIAAGPVIGLAWAVLCVASWFHPQNGTLAPSARFFGRLPGWLQAPLRWYASLFLAVFLVFSLLAWPAFGISNLWHLVR